MADTTKANVILIAPELSTASDDLFTLIIADAALSISTDIVPEAYQEIIQRYLVAHKVTESSGGTGSGATGGPVKREKVGDVEREYRDKLGMVARIMTPAFARTYRVELQAVAASLCARVGLAAERYRLKEGQLPDTLDELVPGYMPQLPLDPFDGKPLRFRHLDKGYVIYSVGQDLTDDQGEARKPRGSRKGQETWDETFTVMR